MKFLSLHWKAQAPRSVSKENLQKKSASLCICQLLPQQHWVTNHLKTQQHTTFLSCSHVCWLSGMWLQVRLSWAWYHVSHQVQSQCLSSSLNQQLLIEACSSRGKQQEREDHVQLHKHISSLWVYLPIFHWSWQVTCPRPASMGQGSTLLSRGQETRGWWWAGLGN